jgi:hypothetical protein
VFVLVKNYSSVWAVKGISRGVHRADQQLCFFFAWSGRTNRAKAPHQRLERLG